VAAEIELKLALDRTAVARAPELVRHPAVAAAKRGRMRTARVASTYYDTPEFALEEARVALRVRRDGARIVQTVKGPPLHAAVGALHAHDEHEWRLARARIDPVRLAETPWRKLFARAQKHGGLAALFTTDVLRRTLPLAFADGSTAVLAIDVGSIRTRRPAGRRVPLAEIEIEVLKGGAAAAYDLALALMDDWPLAVETTSKAARGYALVHGRRVSWQAPVRAGPVAFAPDGPVEEALRSIVRECAHQIADNAAGLVADDDPEWVHQMRIGTRRLRSCLSLIARIAGRASVVSVVAEARWLAGVLGAARDWDVLAGETLPPLAAALAQDRSAAPGWRGLARSIDAHRRAARSAAREAVRSLRFQRMLLAIGALCARPAFGGDRGERVTAQAFADRLLERRHHKLCKRGTALEHGTAEERHAVRVAAKKLRYAAEFFSPPDPGKRNRAYRKALTRLQDALGHWHDAVTATRLTAGLADKSDRATVGAVRGWAAAQLAALEPEIARAWQRFVAADPFWARE
jgi:triphosphatase